jgi:hypothetical protein
VIEAARTEGGISVALALDVDICASENQCRSTQARRAPLPSGD